MENNKNQSEGVSTEQKLYKVERLSSVTPDY